MLDLEKIKRYLRVDFDNDDMELDMLKTVAYEYLKGAVGIDYSNKDNPKAELFVLALIDDIYNNRSLNAEKSSEKMKNIYSSILAQLRCENV